MSLIHNFQVSRIFPSNCFYKLFHLLIINKKQTICHCHPIKYTQELVPKKKVYPRINTTTGTGFQYKQIS